MFSSVCGGLGPSMGTPPVKNPDLFALATDYPGAVVVLLFSFVGFSMGFVVFICAYPHWFGIPICWGFYFLFLD